MSLLRFVMVLMCGFLVSACSNSKLVKTYEGETIAKEQLATLMVGENLQLISVNGRPVPEYLLSNIEVNYGLKPGLNKLVFQYESVWAKARLGQDDSRAEAVVSERRQADVTVAAGELLSFRYQKASNIREAKALAATFEAEIIDQHGEVIAQSGDVVKQAEPEVLVSTALGSATNNASLSSVGQLDNALPTLDAMKLLWEKTSAEDKKSFLKWAFQ